jgi:hypothetical protein
MRNLTTQEHDDLAKIVTDPAAWWSNATNSGVDEEAALSTKLARWAGKHTDTKAERDAADAAAEEAYRNRPRSFQDRMQKSDAILSRTEEDLADALVANGGTIPDALATKVADKKSLRSAG